MSDAPATDRAPSHAELLAMLDSPDLTRREQRELKRAARFQRRVETWEQRRREPAPRTPHRTVITLLMMAACLALLALLVFAAPPS
jgi:hypothetical protein